MTTPPTPIPTPVPSSLRDAATPAEPPPRLADAATPQDPRTALGAGPVRRLQDARTPIEGAARSEAPPPRPPARIGSIRILAPLGQGGMGTVFRGYDERAGRPVVVKMLAGTLADEPGQRVRFQREAEAAASLVHPNIVTIYGVGEVSPGGAPYIAMEMVEGESLDDRLARAGPLPVAEAVRCILGAAWGLAAAHRRGIIHRDIKPSNIMRTAAGGVKVLDFGLARVTFASRLTRTGDVVGTPLFMAPEQARGEPADGRSDIYALGTTLFTLLAGEAPFAGGTPAEVVERVLHDPPPPIGTLRPGLPPRLTNIIERCLAKDPRARPQTAEALAEELEAIAAEIAPASAAQSAAPTVADAPVTAVAGRARRLRLAPVPVGLLVILLIIVAAGTYGAVARMGKDERRERAMAAASPDERCRLLGLFLAEFPGDPRAAAALDAAEAEVRDARRREALDAGSVERARRLEEFLAAYPGDAEALAALAGARAERDIETILDIAAPGERRARLEAFLAEHPSHAGAAEALRALEAETRPFRDLGPRGPGPRALATLTWDAARRVLVLHGGIAPDGAARGDTWEWNGESFDLRRTGEGPTARFAHTLTYDSVRRIAVLFGGTSEMTGPPFADTWLWDGSRWVSYDLGGNPPARAWHAAAFDEGRGTLVVFGGRGEGASMDDTWEWNGTRWTEVVPAGARPPARYGHAMAWDSLRGVVCLFGGTDGARALDDTWIWDGTRWTERRTDVHPEARSGAGMVFDRRRGEALLFGGGATGGVEWSDLWAWDGVHWVERHPLARPPARQSFGMAADDARGVMLLFGGWTGARVLGDLWEY